MYSHYMMFMVIKPVILFMDWRYVPDRCTAVHGSDYGCCCDPVVSDSLHTVPKKESQQTPRWFKIILKIIIIIIIQNVCVMSVFIDVLWLHVIKDVLRPQRTLKYQK